MGVPELHVFTDASAIAYGAAAYHLWNTMKGPHVTLVSAKARVAPVKQTTIPRPELMAALVGCRLAKTVHDALTEKPTVVIWTNSQIVLHWIRSESISLKAFVGVRISEIQSTWDLSHWMYVPTSLNPADDLSRGLDAHRLTGRWMTGPAFLRETRECWPEQPAILVPTQDTERKKPKFVSTIVKPKPIMDCKTFFSWPRLLRVTAYCQRFVRNLKWNTVDASEITGEVLQPFELENAERYWIRNAQGDLADWADRCGDLVPIVNGGLIRVGGRLGRSTLPYEEAHPVLLPAPNCISTLMMRDIHERKGHPGCERTLCDSRRNYWIVRGQNLARETVKNCVKCRKLRQPAHVTLMADLPPERLRTFESVFSTTGVDLFGPFKLKYGRNKTPKAWGALFTCATVRAIHLEIVDGL